MKKFREKGPSIEAIQYDGTFELAFLRGDERVRAAGDGTGACEVMWMGGEHKLRVERSDWIVRDSNGALSKFGPDAFAARFDEVVNDR